MKAKSVVAVVKTTPETVLEDYGKAMEMAGYRKIIQPDHETALKINITWHHWYPACNTAPWQLEGTLLKLLQDGFDRDKIHGCHNRTVVVSAKRGEVANKHKVVLDAYGVKSVHLYEGQEWTRYEPKARMRALHQIYPRGIEIPKQLIGENIIQMPTMKTHVFTTITGAMKNAFGGLLHEKRHWTHSVIHETLVDLLAIQQEIHPGLFAVMDGTFAGDGPGPRCMVPHVKNYILASADQVAIDAVAAKMMGFDPMSLKFIRLATEDGLGMGRVEEVEVVGEDISEVNWHFHDNLNTFASRGQKMIYWGPLKPFEKLLLRTAIVPWSYAASIAYHDLYWYPLIGKERVRAALATPWGRLFSEYEAGLYDRASAWSAQAA
jgi:uncharacterized protein (DUF362 family)